MEQAKTAAKKRNGYIHTGEIEEELNDEGKNKAAVALGRKGDAARAKKLSKKRKSEIARKAAEKRWGKRT